MYTIRPMSSMFMRKRPGAESSSSGRPLTPEPRFILGVFVLTAVVALLLARLLPATGVGMWFRLATATACVLLVPGALITQALGRFSTPTDLVAGAIPWSLVAIFFTLMATFAARGSLLLTIVLLGLVAVGALTFVLAAPAPIVYRRATGMTALVPLVAGLLFGLLLWFGAPPIVGGDALEHLARVRKLAEMATLRSGVTELFRGATLHPGYAFPLWHGAVALIARLAGVDSAAAMRWLPALLAPLSFMVTYAAGRALFRSDWGGLAVLAGQLGYFALANRGLGQFLLFSQPHQAALFLLVPCLMALLFAFVESPKPAVLLSLSAASLSLAVVHPSYGVFIVVPVFGFLVARLLMGRPARTDCGRIALGLAAIAVPAAMFFLWLVPAAVRATPSFRPPTAERASTIAHYPGQILGNAEQFRLSPRAISTAGPVAVIALLGVPLAGLARRSRWSAMVIGGTLPVLLLLLVPELFRALTDFVSISQGRRLINFLPWPFAFASAALVLARFRLAGMLAGLGLGIAFLHFYPGDFSYASSHGGGPAWPVWVALGGAVAGFVAGTVRPRRDLIESRPDAWIAGVAAALIAPVAFSGLTSAHPRDRRPLTPGLIVALRSDVKPGDVVFAPVTVSYQIVAYAPVYVAAVPVGHAWDRPYQRVRDVEGFFSPQATVSDQERVLRKYQAAWLVVNKLRLPANLDSLTGHIVYRDQSYSLYRLGSL